MIKRLMVSVLVGGAFAVIAGAANASGWAIKIGTNSITAQIVGSGGGITDKSFFFARIPSVNVNVLCVNQAGNNGNPYTASTQYTNITSEQPYSSIFVDKDKGTWSTGLLKFAVNPTSADCVNDNWYPVSYLNPGYENWGDHKVYIATSVNVEVSVGACDYNNDPTCKQKPKIYATVTCTANPYWDIYFNNVTLTSVGGETVLEPGHWSPGNPYEPTAEEGPDFQYFTCQ